jgi:hypothetical protein
VAKFIIYKQAVGKQGTKIYTGSYSPVTGDVIHIGSSSLVNQYGITWLVVDMHGSIGYSDLSAILLS